MSTPTAPRKRPPRVAEFDVPAAQVTAEAKALKAQRDAHLFDDLQRAIPGDDGPHAELRHLLDADPDTAVPTPGIPHPKNEEEEAAS